MSYRHLGARAPDAAPLQVDAPHIAFVLAGPIIAAGNSRAKCVERAARRWSAEVHEWGGAPLTHGQVYVAPADAALVEAVMMGARFIIPGDSTPDQPLAPTRHTANASPAGADAIAAHRRNLLTAIDDIWGRADQSGVPASEAAEMFAATFGLALQRIIATGAGEAAPLLELLELQIGPIATPAGEGAQ
jgi:hypothetical protein